MSEDRVQPEFKTYVERRPSVQALQVRSTQDAATLMQLVQGTHDGHLKLHDGSFTLTLFNRETGQETTVRPWQYLASAGLGAPLQVLSPTEFRVKWEQS